jgi:hypothetical protein
MRGRVVLFPSTPVETGSGPVKGVATTVAVESEDGELRQVETESDGTFEIGLPPGRYLVSARPPPGSTYVPVPHRVVVVRAGMVARVTVILGSRLREP